LIGAAGALMCVANALDPGQNGHLAIRWST
jgi:hypothetical protein